MYSLAIRITGDTQEAEDVVLEVFLQVWQRASDYQKERGKVSTWLITIARSRAIDHRRRTLRRHQVIQSVEDDPELIEKAQDTGEDAFQIEHRRQVRQILNGLPEVQRKALELAYFEGMSQSEIAEALGEPLGTVKTRIRSGLAALRAGLVSYS